MKLKIGKMKLKKFNGKLIKVSERPTILPNGYKVILEVVEHPGAVLIVPFIDNNRMVLIKQYRPLIGQYIYELPAGTLAPAEKHIVCARRELLEETGYRARKITRLGQIYPACGYVTERIVLYKAEGLKKEEVAPEQDEIISLCVMTKAQIKKLFRSGKIIDAKTICALAYCGWV